MRTCGTDLQGTAEAEWQLEDASHRHRAAAEGEEGGTVQPFLAKELWKSESRLDKSGIQLLCRDHGKVLLGSADDELPRSGHWKYGAIGQVLQ